MQTAKYLFSWVPQLYIKLSFSIEILTENFQQNIEMSKVLGNFEFELWELGNEFERWDLSAEIWVTSKPNMPLDLEIILLGVSIWDVNPMLSNSIYLFPSPPPPQI